MNERDRQLGWNWTYWERVMKPLLEELGTSSLIEAALVAPDSKLRLQVTVEKSPRGKSGVDASAMEFLLREEGKDVYLFACKKEGPTVQVRFRGLPQEFGRGQVMLEEPRVVEAKNGSFTDWFGPYDVHVYRFAR